jgi:hypothetical protein
LTAGQDISCDLLQPRPRNLTGSNRRLRKDKRQKTNMQKAGVRWAGHLDGDTQQPCPPPESLLCTVANKEVEQKFWWGGGRETGGTCDHYSLNINILGKSAVLHFALASFCGWGCANSTCRLLGIAVLCQVLIGFSDSALHISPFFIS